MRSFAWLTICFFVAWTGPASAQTHYRTLMDDPVLHASRPVVWDPDGITYELHDGGFVPAQRMLVLDAVRQGARSWHELPCTAPPARFAGWTSTPARADDGRNTLQWLDHDWEGRGFDREAAAVTDLQLDRGADGTVRIVEADILFNAEHYGWSPGLSGAIVVSTRRAAMHEWGHAYGMLHPCELGAVDSAPDCVSWPGYRDSALFPVHLEGPTRPSEDDAAGTCLLYPGVDALCRSDRECSSGLQCRAGHCHRPVDDGESCIVDADCESSTCDRGVCTHRCADGGEADCSPVGPARPPCDDGEDCSSGLCLVPVVGAPFCTVGCAEDAKCGEGEGCIEVDGDRVCALRSAPSAGCAAAPTRNEVPCIAALLFILGCWLCRAGRRGVRQDREQRICQ